MMNGLNKKLLMFVFGFSCACSVYSIGLDVGAYGAAGASFGIAGKQVEANAFPWESADTFLNCFSGGGNLEADCLLTPKWAVQTGLGVMTFGRVYTTADGNKYGNGSISLRYTRLILPIGIQYRHILSKTTQDIRSLYLSAGFICSYLLGSQIYKDDFTTASLHFLQPLFSCAGYISAEYVRNLGVGNLSLGIRFMIDILSSQYSMPGTVVDIGNAVTVTPVIGFSIPIIKHQAVEKEQAKRKRVDVIWN